MRRARAGACGAIGTLLLVLALLTSCGGRKTPAHGLRIGYLPNITHAVAMVAADRGLFPARKGVAATLVPFNDGPTAVEALLAGDIDVTYCGPGPAINVFVRTRGRVRVLSGAASGGAAFVVRGDLPFEKPADFARARLATPQTGNSQDIALRNWLQQHELDTTDRGGTVQVVPMPNSQILSLFRQKQIDGAWVPEPWSTRLQKEAGGRVFLDEGSLWPEGRYPTTVLVVSTRFVREHPDEARALLRGNKQAIVWIRNNPAAAQKIVNATLEKQTGKKLPDALLQASWKHLLFTEDPLTGPLKEIARSSRRIGYTPSSELRGLVLDSAELAAAHVPSMEANP